MKIHKPFRRPPTRQPIPFKQLCMLARDLAEHTLSYLDEPGQWKEAIKWRVIALEFTYPEDPSAIVRAMEQVRYALDRLGVKPPSVHRRQQWTSLADLVTSLSTKPSSKT